MPGCPACGEPAKTVEHVLPRWLIEALGDTPLLFESAQLPNRLAELATVDQRTTTTFGRKTVKFCATCNNGWMSQLEKDAKPVLLQMATGVGRVMTARDCEVVYAWAAKTMVVASQASSRPLSVEVARRVLSLARRQVAQQECLVRSGRIGGEVDGRFVVTQMSTPGGDLGGFDASLRLGLACVIRCTWVHPDVPMSPSGVALRTRDGLVTLAPSVDWSRGRWILGPELQAPGMQE